MRPAHLALLTICLAPSAFAEPFYAGAEIGLATFDDTADADRIPSCGAQCVPSAVSINGTHFDSEETAWSVFAGWNIRDWVSIELAWSDLGETGDTLDIPSSLVMPQVIQYPAFPAAFDGIFFVDSAIVSPVDSAALSVEELTLSTVFRKQLAERFSASWSLGVIRASFDTKGSIPVGTVSSSPPPTITYTPVPFAAPDDEFGFLWGIGGAWHVTDRIDVELTYRNHDVRVVDVETYSLRIAFEIG